ncbi:MAG: histidinol dehydrogenase [Microcystaceae cyanobacterium]
MGNLLRMITEHSEALSELNRLGDRLPILEERGEIVRVLEILEQVKRDPDQALTAFSESFGLKIPSLRVSGSELDAAYQQIPQELLKAIQVACRQLETFHRQQLPKNWVKFGENDTVFAQRFAPVQRAGVYVTGAGSSRLSNLLQQVIPAKVAAVPQVVMATPSGDNGKIPPELLVAAQEAGVEEIYRLEGAKAIAVLAYGTPTIKRTDLITGVGSREVTLAKQLVRDGVKTDRPLERADLMLVADSSANPHHLALDLLAQAEQDPTAALILLTTDEQLAKTVQELIPRYIQSYQLGLMVEKAIAHYGLIIVVQNWAEALTLINQFRPYYLLVTLAEPWDLVEKVQQAQTILIGPNTPRAIADYFGGSAKLTAYEAGWRSTTQINVHTFLQVSNVIEYSPQTLKQILPSLANLVQTEDLKTPLQNLQLRTVPQHFGDRAEQ